MEFGVLVKFDVAHLMLGVMAQERTGNVVIVLLSSSRAFLLFHSSFPILLWCW